MSRRVPDTFALVVSWFTLAFATLALVVAFLLQGWWMMLTLPAFAALMFGLVGVTSYRLDT